jgi:transposase-like protein
MKKEFTALDKTTIVLAALKGILTNSQISSKHSVHPVQIGHWKKQALKLLREGFSDSIKKDRDHLESKITELYTIIGQKEMELSWLKKKLGTLDSP